jgi:hypothetical protein
MKPSSRLARTPINLPDSTCKQLNAYALAACAAGVGVLALAQPAGAKIVYTPAHVKFGRNTQIAVDLNHDGIADFNIINNFSNFGYRNSYRLFASAYGLPTAFVGKQSRGSGRPLALPAGAHIGPHRHFSHDATSMAHFYTSSGRITISSGVWKNVKNRYLGVKFVIKGKTHYGWARLSVTMHRNGIFGISAVLTGYAFETVANRPIIAGRTSGAGPVTAEPATLGHLARGAAAISAWRLNRVSATTH